MNQKDKDVLKFLTVIVVLCIIVHIFNVMMSGTLSRYGLFPRQYTHAFGLVTYPYIHGSWAHLISNIVSFSVLAFLTSRSGLSRLIAVYMICWVGSGIGVWLFGRPHYHVGLSGIIYGIWAYLLTYAVMYRSIKSIVIAVLVMFIYGSMVWGFIPVNQWVSYESHLFGAISGMLAGYIFAKRDKKKRMNHVSNI
ncbi:rhomboid family intramembrane serine protease [Photobacterium minamisatsumaniensis]|uniref:rhomboid family intramembrane serine protease n=1 Tax=Photobacterium minamisatsumaniensis TaxID=2910233 RepID=UPI003D112DF2